MNNQHITRRSNGFRKVVAFFAKGAKKPPTLLHRLAQRYAKKMMKIFLLLFVLSSQAFAGSSSVMIIDELISKDNYPADAWFARGLNPSPEATIFLLNSASKEFLINLKALSNSPNSDLEILKSKVSKLVDELPWEQLDTEEKEFMADVLAPAIESLGLNPWHIF